MTLAEFCRACKAHCLERQNQSTCQECAHMIIAAGIVQRETICSLPSLPSLFRQAFPNVTYSSHAAKKRLLKMPLACIRVSKPSDGTSQLVVMEFVKGADYVKIQQILTTQLKKSPSLTSTLTKQDVKQLLNLAQSNREKECLRYAIFKASGLISLAARKQLGFERMAERSAEVERCIKEAEEIGDLVKN